MKKASLVLIILTLICCAFSGGFFLGRGTGSNAINISSIPTVVHTATQVPTDGATQPGTTFPIDINTATADQFATLPGIGDTIAQRIVAYRNANGPFRTIADLLYIEGIGEKKLEAILDYITIIGS